MSSRRDELNKIISSKSITFSYWVTLLNFFEKYQTELDIIDVRLLVIECEHCRVELNKKIIDKIRPEDTRPDIYTFLKNLEAKLEENNNKKESAPLCNAVMVPQ